jgi:hypothetical protein
MYAFESCVIGSRGFAKTCSAAFDSGKTKQKIADLLPIHLSIPFKKLNCPITWRQCVDKQRQVLFPENN